MRFSLDFGSGELPARARRGEALPSDMSYRLGEAAGREEGDEEPFETAYHMMPRLLADKAM